VTRESVGLDLQLVMHFGRRDVLRNPECVGGDDGLADCRTKDKVFFPMGFGFMGFVDGANLVSTVLNALQ